jgi:AcrR family transcriptional regulator
MVFCQNEDVSQKSLAPQQERSRQTLDSLLTATIQVLDQHGLENTTIPRIAEAAKVAPASLYRRFADKDALIRAALLNVMDSSASSIKDSLAPERFATKSIEAASRSLVCSIFQQYRRHPRLLMALKRFSERESEKEFERRATELFSENFHCMVVALSACKGLAQVRQREKKIRFALMTVVSAIEVMVLEPSSLWNVLLTDTDEQIQEQLVKMLLAHLRA